MTEIVEVGTKPLPVAVITAGEVPVITVLAEREEMTGGGLSTANPIGALMELRLLAVSVREAAVVSCEAGTMAVT